jgi:hypothetical protein
VNEEQIEKRGPGRPPKVHNVAEVEEIIREDEDDTRLGFFSTAQDPFRGAIVEPGYRHAIVTEHQAAHGLPSMLLEARRLGYHIAPAPASVRRRWDESKQWTMRIPDAIYEERKKIERQRGDALRAAHATPAPGFEVIEDRRDKASMADILNG